MFGGFGLLSLYWLFGLHNALIAYCLILFAVLAVDMARLHFAVLNEFIMARFSSFIRENEANKLTGIVPYVTGIGLTFLFYRPYIATMAILFLICGDVAATTVGELFGQTKIAGNKSLEGSVAFFVAACMSTIQFNLFAVAPPYGVLLFGAVVATWIELLPLPLNDNLTIPLAAGGAMELLSRMIGGL